MCERKYDLYEMRRYYFNSMSIFLKTICCNVCAGVSFGMRKSFFPDRTGKGIKTSNRTPYDYNNTEQMWAIWLYRLNGELQREIRIQKKVGAK